LKCAIKVPGDPVTFLGRVWPDPWGSNLSFFDPLRCLSKLHFSDNSDKRVPVSLLAWRKAVSYYVTDNGNIVGHIAEHILNITRQGKTEVVERRPWLAAVLLENTHYTTEQIVVKFRGSSVFPTYQSNPRDLTLDGEFEPALVYLSSQTGISCDDILAWYRDLRSREFLDFPCLHRVEASSSKPTSVDGELIGGPMAKAPIDLSKIEGKKPVDTPVPPACKFFFSKDGCRRGDKCRFNHSKNICRDFLKGACKRDKCRFEHVALSAPV